MHESQRDLIPRASRRSEARPGLWSRLTGRAAGAEPGAGSDEGLPVAAAPAPAEAEAEAAAEVAPEAPEPAPGRRRETRPAAAENGARADNGSEADTGARGARFRERGTRDARGGQSGGLKDRIAGRAARRETRHVRAVPANDDVKVERALELFNASEHVRTIAGIARSLGDPWVMAAPIASSPSEVAVVVAWELSWYRYRIDLGDGDQPVMLFEKGEEIGQLDDALKEWNATAQADGSLSVAAGAEARA